MHVWYSLARLWRWGALIPVTASLPLYSICAAESIAEPGVFLKKRQFGGKIEVFLTGVGRCACSAGCGPARPAL